MRSEGTPGRTFELPAELVAALTYFPAEGAGGSMEVRPSRLR